MSQHPLVLRIIPSVWDVPYCSFNLNIDHFAKKEFLVDLPIGELQLERHRGCLIELHFIQQLPAESRFLGSDFRLHLFFFAIFSPAFLSHHKKKKSGSRGEKHHPKTSADRFAKPPRLDGVGSCPQDRQSR